MYCFSAPKQSFFAYFVTLEFDPADYSSPLPRHPVKLYQQSAVMETARGDQKWLFLLPACCLPRGNKRFGWWRGPSNFMAQQCTHRGQLRHLQSCRRLLRTETGPLGQVCHHSGCSSHSSQQELHPQSFFITTKVWHSSVTATAVPQKSETQPHGASASKGPSSFLIHISPSICYLCTPRNALFPF